MTIFTLDIGEPFWFLQLKRQDKVSGDRILLGLRARARIAYLGIQDELIIGLLQQHQKRVTGAHLT